MRKSRSKRKKKVSTLDPFCNIASRRQLVAAQQNQLNLAPDDPDDQPITYKQRQLMKAVNGLKFPNKNQKDKNQNKKVKRLQDGASRPTRPVKVQDRKTRKKKKVQGIQRQESKDMEDTLRKEARQDKLTRLPNESDKKFLRRIRTQADTEIKNQMDEIQLLGKHAPDILDDIKEKKVSKRDKERSEKKKEKKKEKLLEKKIDRLEDQFFKADKVEFGDVVGRPPELSFMPRKSQPSNNAGQRSNLLLANLMQKTSSTSTSKATKATVKVKTQKHHKFKKRKDMDNAEKRMFDKARQEAILAYRKVRADAMAKRPNAMET